jgi:hypothetical protein
MDYVPPFAFAKLDRAVSVIFPNLVYRILGVAVASKNRPYNGRTTSVNYW